MSNALQIVQKAFPNVTKIVDATKDSEVEVTKRDTNSATVKNHKACAMAVACKRKFELDGVIISSSIAYMVSGNKATRYKVPQCVSREIVSFDRGAAFEPGEYKLKAIAPSAKLGQSKTGTVPSGKHSDNPGRRQVQHKTENIRLSLNSRGGAS